MMHRLLKAIVVEDDPRLRHVFTAALSADPGITTAEAGSLAGAVELCKAERQVVLLVDLGLPDARGAEAVRRLRRELPGATLVVVTGRDEQVGAAKEAGAHEVILKGSAESHGPALTDAVRRAVVRHDTELLFTRGHELMEERRSKLDEASRLLLPPLVLLAVLCGSVAAAPRSAAADRMRAENATRALAWGAGSPDTRPPGS